jgi:hypothetical protein
MTKKFLWNRHRTGSIFRIHGHLIVNQLDTWPELVETVECSESHTVTFPPDMDHSVNVVQIQAAEAMCGEVRAIRPCQGHRIKDKQAWGLVSCNYLETRRGYRGI